MLKFIDEAKIWIKAGDGGDGCVAFRREKFVPRGGPSGGDGGNGADVIFTTKKDVRTLIDFHYRQHFKAEDGAAGQGSKKEGKSGENLVIFLPIGTLIREITDDGEILLADLVKENECFVGANGGKGGKGNTHFKSSTNQAPRKFTNGEKGEEKYIHLELKLLADAGIVGLPNSGKSTLISKISAARPKIADYPFTTLVPNLGVVNLGAGRSFVIADIPGIIEKASEGRGLGYQFLKHVERTKILVHLVDLSLPDALQRYWNIRQELEKYGKDLSNKKEIVVGNKTDLPGTRENAEIFRKKFKEVCFISAMTGEGIKPMLEAVWRKIHQEIASDSYVSSPSRGEESTRLKAVDCGGDNRENPSED